MITVRRYVIDTCVLIDYFADVFQVSPSLSPRARKILDNALTGTPAIALIIPAVVFLEVFEKWCTTESFCRRFQNEVYLPLKNLYNVEIRPIDREVMEAVLDLNRTTAVPDMHDRIILASAIVLQCPLLTSDHAIRKYVATHQVIPGAYS